MSLETLIFNAVLARFRELRPRPWVRSFRSSPLERKRYFWQAFSFEDLPLICAAKGPTKIDFQPAFSGFSGIATWEEWLLYDLGNASSAARHYWNRRFQQIYVEIWLSQQPQTCFEMGEVDFPLWLQSFALLGFGLAGRRN